MAKKQPPKHLRLGRQGEQMAVDYLRQKNYQILAQNWRYDRAEIDIIASLPSLELIVFVEVKTRSTHQLHYGHPEDAVTPKKEKLLAKAAEAYLVQEELDLEMRFDIIAITVTANQTKINHIEDAFFFYDE